MDIKVGFEIFVGNFKDLRIARKVLLSIDRDVTVLVTGLLHSGRFFLNRENSSAPCHDRVRTQGSDIQRWKADC